jgi:predicted ATPase/signal transduction histidine kinase
MDKSNQGNSDQLMGIPLWQLDEYQIIEIVYSGSRTLVYRGIRIHDQLSVIIKLLNNNYPTFSELVQFRNQYTIAKNLNSPLIVKTYSLEQYQNSYALVMEDFGGISLQEWRQKGKNTFSLIEFLQIAIDLCNILNILYHERIIHKDIKPSNILINPQTKEIKLIDFSISSLLPRETQTLINPNVLEGTLAYISPEQTGRMNRGIDYRTDFYSLGVTFYELLTGVLPFQSIDPMELVHSHIAKLPPLLPNREKFPQVISDIVAKLMAKNAEDRYQSALGLKFDLENCLHQLQANGRIESFKIAVRDLCDRFIIPDKLYGRETEVETLLNAFDRVSAGATEMMLVAGFSGIGKTAVVNEVHKPIVRQRGYFIKGKYDQFQRNIPFSAFVQAFRDLMGQLLSESESQIQQWKSKILEAVGENGQVIIEVIPELSKIIGEQPPTIELSGDAAQNRFNLLFQKFTQVFTSAEHPLVIFLDDLHWADSASLQLMQLLMADTGHLLLIGAYRDNEVNPAHPLMLTLSEMQKNLFTINTITLAPLSQGQVNQLVADTLKCTASLAWVLSQQIFQKTQGNPFFVTQFLKALHQEELITFDFELGCWQCDIAQVITLAATDDVVAFMAFQLRKLPPSTQQVLQLAACIGNRFDLTTLAIVSEQSEIETATALWKALQEGLILPLNDVYKFYVGQENQVATQQNSQKVIYTFLHDRIQQAAYSLIPDDQKIATHLQIGQLLQQNLSELEIESKLFDIVEHLNLGIALITQASDRQALAHLNLQTGVKARNATAYAAARVYLQTGLKLLEPNCWQHQYELALALYVAAGEVAYLNGDFEGMEQLATIVLQSARTIVDKIKIYEIQIAVEVLRINVLGAIKVGRTALKQLGVELPTAINEAQITEILKTLSTQLEGRQIEDLSNLPVMTDPTTQAALKVMGILFSPILQGMPSLLPWLSATMVSLSLKSGNTEASVTGYGIHGMVLCAFLGDTSTGYAFGKLALNLLEKFNALQIKPFVMCLFGCFIQHSQERLDATIPILKAAHNASLESGDFLQAGFALFGCSSSQFFSGQELSSLIKDMDNYSGVLAQIKQKPAQVYLDLGKQAAENLTELSKEPHYLIGNTCNEVLMFQKHQQDNDLIALGQGYIYKLLLAYYFANYTDARNYIDQIKLYFMAVSGSIFVPIFHFYAALTHLALFPTHPEAEQDDLLIQVQTHQTILSEWAHHAPMNYQHKFDLVAAEKCRVLGQKAEAVELYDKAIAGAKTNKYIQEQALANELAAKFYLSWDKPRIAQEYMTEAYYGYTHWGAKAKVTNLETHYPQLLTPILSKTRHPHPHDETLALETLTASNVETVINSSNNFSVALDLASILKASQALSSEIRLDKLLATLLEVVIESAGADKCVLILERDEQLLIKGTITVNTEPVVLQKIPIEESTEIPLKLIYKVKRNQQTIVLTEATADSTLATDPYIINQQPKSILCSPILHQGKLRGILYLENNLTLGAFTSDRVELLNVLCAQAAISLENARLYQKAQQALLELQQAQLQIVQSEKMSALGNLVAGVAHEINNPIGFIAGNLSEANRGLQDLIDYVHLYQEKCPEPGLEVREKAEEIDLDYLIEDLPNMLGSMKTGCDRIKFISKSLRTFSRADTDKKQIFDTHEGIDSTVMILRHQLKANEQHPAIEVVTNYGNLPQIKCFPGQLNQVFMNILANAIDAFEEANYGRSFAEIQANPNKITITTTVVDDYIQISIMDNGNGMKEEIKAKIFDHLFTTKEVGKGTGLGLAIAKQIVEEKHQGTISVNSKLGQGTEFIITLPIDIN